MSYSESGWRNTAQPIIAAVLRDNCGSDISTIRRALREAYPFGQRKFHPYKIWLDEIAVQLGRKLPASERSASQKAKISARIANETIGDLFT